ncbi:MAG TPA: hypothetical protein VE732_02830 [Nitrososphaera sp.]|jgi:hypothetical protein|nr:hypothetical protein [Nitrososphaera sp.]
MKASEIREGGIYRGAGVCSERYVDFVWMQDGRLRVHWRTPKKFVAKRSDGVELWYPNRDCWLEYFARWAEAEIGFDRKNLLRNIPWIKARRKKAHSK